MNKENRITTTPELRKKIILGLLENRDSVSIKEISSEADMKRLKEIIENRVSEIGPEYDQ